MQKTHKRIVSFLLTALMLLPFSGMKANAEVIDPDVIGGSCGYNVTWSYSVSTQALTLSGSGTMDENSTPWTQYGSPKTVHVNGNFQGLTNFGFWQTEQFSANSDVYSVTDGVLFTDNGLTLLAYPNGSTRTSYAVPDNVTKISENAFGITPMSNSEYNLEYYNHFLRQLDLGNVQVLVDEQFFLSGLSGSVFWGLSALESITVPDENPVFQSIDGVLFANHIRSGNTYRLLAAYPPSRKDTAYSIPQGTTDIINAFHNNTYLQKIIVPSSVRYIAGNPFVFARTLTEIEVADENLYYSTDAQGVLFNRKKTELICYPQGKTQITYSMPASTQIIGYDAFYGCEYLQSIFHEKSDNLRTIRTEAFLACSALSYVELGNEIEQIGRRAFEGTHIAENETYWHDNALFYQNCLLDTRWNSLEHIDILPGTRLIAERAFLSCRNLESVSIPSSVHAIGIRAFSDTPLYQNQANWTDGGLYIDGCLIEMQPNSTGTYEIRPGTRIIADCAFRTGITSKNLFIKVPQGVTDIGVRAFFNVALSTADLPFYYIPKSVKRIGTQAFCVDHSSVRTAIYYTGNQNDWAQIRQDDQDYVRYVIFGNEAETKTYGDYDYQVSDDNTVTITGYHNSTGATKAELPAYIDGKPVIHIGEYAFAGLASDGYAQPDLKEIIIPNTVETIGDGAFLGLPGLQKVNIPPNVREIGRFAFEDCVQLYDVIHDAFSDLQAYVSAQEDSSSHLLTIGDRAFYGCAKLRQAFIPDTVKTVGTSAFENCENIQSVYVGLGVTSIGQNAFKGCDRIKTVVYGAAETATQHIQIADGNDALQQANTVYMKKQGTYTVQIPLSLSLQYKNSETLRASVLLNGADTNDSVVWQTDNPKIAAVDKNGKVTGTGKGQTTIRAVYTAPDGSKISSACTVTVKYAWWQILIRIFLLGFIWY